MILSPELLENNIIQRSYPLPDLILEALDNEDWSKIDQYFFAAEGPQGALFEFLKSYVELTSLEHIISIRSAPGDEDGIWHDDGSRILGFTLSLTVAPEEIVGGHLRFRKKGEEKYQSLPTRPLGEMLIFKTGIYGFEHMVSAVTKGKRILIAGWCS